MPGFISSLSYTFDNVGGTWETAKLPEDKSQTVRTADNDVTPNVLLSSPGVLQLPKTVQVSVGFTPFGVYRPEYNGVMYSLYDDGNTGDGIESGLMPNSDTKVNYFRAIDTKDDGTRASITDPDNKALLSSPLTDAKLDELTEVQPTLTDNTNDAVTTVRGDTTGLRSGASDVQLEKNLTPAAATVPGNPQSETGQKTDQYGPAIPNNDQYGPAIPTTTTSGTSVPADVPPKETEVVTDAEFDAAFTPAPIASEQVQPYNFPETTGKTDKPKSKKKKKKSG